MVAQKFNHINADVKIQGKLCDFSLLKLHQTMFGHHHFVITVNYRAKRKDLWNTTADTVLEHMGESITIQIKDSNGEMVDFVGVINKIDISGSNSDQGEVILYGGSPTVLMTDDYSMDSFEEYDLASIVQETITNIGYPIEYKIEPLNNPTIPYVCRYKESSYDFLHRLLASCGEWFFYDGKKIIVGFSKEPISKQGVELSYRHDIIEMKISSTLGNFDVEQFDYDVTIDKTLQWISEPNSSHLNKFTSRAFKKSKEIHKDWTVLPSKIPIINRSFGLMENSVYAEHYGKLSDGSLLEATTNTCRVGLGKIISVEISPELDKYARNMGRFRVIDVLHTYDNNKAEYTNNIVCVNAEIDYIPSRDVPSVMAMPEIAKVVDNADPKRLGRVKVQFLWHRLKDHSNVKTSSWMRVQTLHAGGNDAEEKNRGFTFIPEIGDQVMVGYEYGDPSRPFVMGGMFHYGNTSGATTDNTIKSIKTRGGHSIIFDDSSGAESITISDKNGNEIVFDTNGKNISLFTPETLTIRAKNMVVTVEETLTQSIGTMQTTIEKGMKQEVGQEMEMYGQNIVLTVEKDMEVTTTGNVSLHTNNFVVGADGNVAIEASGKALIQGGQEIRISKG